MFVCHRVTIIFLNNIIMQVFMSNRDQSINKNFKLIQNINISLNNLMKNRRLYTCRQLTYFIIEYSRPASWWVSAVLKAVRAVALVCDIITFPIHLLLQRPWRKRTLSRRIKVRVNHFTSIHQPTNTFIYHDDASYLT